MGKFMHMMFGKRDSQNIKPIRIETMQMVEGVTFECLQSTMVEVFKRGGFATLAPFLGRFLQELETYALDCCERGWDEHLQRAIVSSRLASEYLPENRSSPDIGTYGDGQADRQRRMAIWDCVLSNVCAQDRAFIESIKEADSVLAMLLRSSAAHESAQCQRIAELIALSKTINSTKRYVG